MCHLDIKMENVLISFENTLKLCDFGFAKSTSAVLSGLCGTSTYMAPEIVSEQHDYDGVKADIFSLGVLLYIMKFGQPPFVCADIRECKYWRMMYNKPDKFFRLHPHTKQLFKDDKLDNDFIDLFINMVAPNPKNRLSID